MEQVLFWFFSAVAVATALYVVAARNPLHSALSLIGTFFALACVYVLLGAHMLAALQVLVYAGAVMVLFVFVIMLLSTDTPSLDLGRTPGWMKATAAAIALGLFAFLTKSFKEMPAVSAPGVHTPEAIAQAGGNTQVISELMFSQYILPFELTSVLLLAGIVGAVAIAKRHQKKGATNAAAGR